MGKKPPFITLLLLMPFAAISALLFTPALPLIGQKFHIGNSAVSTAMTIFLFGYALGNLLYGPFAKRYGRKPSIYLGISISLLGIFLILLSDFFVNFPLLLIGRFLTAIGSTSGMKISYTMIGDSFTGAKATKIISLASLSFAIAPSLSVAIGGILTSQLGWTSCFYALAIYNLLLLTLALKLPETAPYLDKQALDSSHIIETYKKKFLNKQLVLSALLMGSVTSILYLFSSLAPFIAISDLKLDPETYGLFNFIPPIGLILGCLTSSRLSSYKSPFEVLSLGFSVVCLMVAVLFGLFFIGDINIWTLFLPIPFLYFGTSLMFNNAVSLALEKAHDKSNGSAVMSFVNISFATFSVLVSNFLKGSNPIVLPTLYIVLVLIISLLRNRLKKAL